MIEQGVIYCHRRSTKQRRIIGGLQVTRLFFCSHAAKSSQWTWAHRGFFSLLNTSQMHYETLHSTINSGLKFPADSVGNAKGDEYCWIDFCFTTPGVAFLQQNTYERWKSHESAHPTLCSRRLMRRGTIDRFLSLSYRPMITFASFVCGTLCKVASSEMCTSGWALPSQCRCKAFVRWCIYKGASEVFP